MRYVVPSSWKIVCEPPWAVAKPSVRVSTFWGVPTVFPNVVGPLGLYPLGYIFYILRSFFMVVYAEKSLLCSMLSFSGVMLALMLLYMVGYAKMGQLWSRWCWFLVHTSLLALHSTRVFLRIRLGFRSLFGVSLSRVILGSQHSCFPLSNWRMHVLCFLYPRSMCDFLFSHD